MEDFELAHGANLVSQWLEPQIKVWQSDAIFSNKLVCQP